MANKVKAKIEDGMVRLNNRVPAEIYDKLRKRQYDTRESMNAQVVRYITEGLKREEKKK